MKFLPVMNDVFDDLFYDSFKNYSNVVCQGIKRSRINSIEHCEEFSSPVRASARADQTLKKQ